ncbi:hypothetical protein HEMROJRC1_20630 [Rodentibacter sp. JRC1]|uniref:hypothetical protein n=1 Tax=Rodentibacter sp. JRC1 TaxID=2874504 RepID=UPI001CFEF1CB|nr:hypothetical protein [Rodentibacter sp. JRC1]GJI56951.1 hypothetical protein HEMROJRC1_20630 [Rodentibacter sp. JRC1]
MTFEHKQNNRVTIRIPYSVLEIIDRILDNRIGDGESSVTRHSIAVELLKLGARIEKKKLDNIETGGNPFDNRLEEQLSFIANSIIRTSLQVERFSSVFFELNKVSPDLFNRIVSEVKLSEKEKMLLKRLFIDTD